jgi:hypothetical protein
MDSVGVLGLAFLRGPRLIPLYVCSSIALNFGSCTVTMYMLRSCLAYFGRLDFGLCVAITYRVKYQIITSAITVTSVSGHSFHVLKVVKNCYLLMCPRLHRHTTMVRCLGLGNTRRRINPKHVLCHRPTPAPWGDHFCNHEEMLWKPRHTLKAAASVTIRRILRHPPPSLLLAQYIDTD